MSSLFKTLRYLKPYLFTALLALGALILVTAGNLAIPILSQRIIDAGITPQRSEIIINYSLLLVGSALLQAGASFLQTYWSAEVSQGVAYDLRNKLYRKIQALSFSYHDQAQTGQLLTRATSDVELVHGFLGTTLLRILSAGLLLIGSLTFMLLTQPQITLSVLALIPLAVGLLALFFMRARPLFRESQQRLEQLNITLQENLAGVRVVRAFVQQTAENAHFNQCNAEVQESNVAVGQLIALAMPTVFLIANLATLTVTWLGGIRVINAELSLGELVAFTSYILMIILPIFLLSFLLANGVRAAAGAERIFEVLEAEIEIVESAAPRTLTNIRGKIEFINVSFRYFESQAWILEGINFTAAPGERIALLGATGSGKSTLTNLIPRFYDASRGQVRLDGYDIRELKLSALRQQVGIVLQETQLFAGTIRQNIAFGRPDAPLTAIIAAAKAAQAHDFITDTPEGYASQVGERGINLSGGQKQRLAIARALLINPRILILDDATSAVDFQTELAIRRALAELMRGRTSFIIAQRVSTVQNADQILLLEQGRLVAQGQHDELLENCALYAEIYYSQLKGAAASEEKAHRPSPGTHTTTREL